MKPRMPEGIAIVDSPEISMEQYCEIMKKLLGKEFVRCSRREGEVRFGIR